MDWFYSSSVHQTFENDPELFQDSHHLLDASIAYADLNGDWSLTLGVHNAADERIVISGGIGRVPGFGDRNFNRHPPPCSSRGRFIIKHTCRVSFNGLSSVST